MTLTIRDIAAAAGVAVGTASRALNGTGSVAPATRERVLAVAAELNYVPNAQARSLRSDRTGTVGLLIPDARNPYFAELSYWIERTMHKHGVSVLMCSANEDPALMKDYLQVLRTQRVDGVILAPFYSAEPILRDMANSGTSMVFVDRTIPSLSVPSVTSDTSAAIDEAVQHLAALGHSTIGYISGPQNTSTGRERLAEFEQAASNLNLHVSIEEGTFQVEAGRRGIRHLLDQGVRAVIAADSLMTQGAISECLDHDISLASDLTLIGFDETPASQFVRPHLPLVIQDIPALARESAELLFGLESKSSTPSSVRVPATFRLAPPAHDNDNDRGQS